MTVRLRVLAVASAIIAATVLSVTVGDTRRLVARQTTAELIDGTDAYLYAGTLEAGTMIGATEITSDETGGYSGVFYPVESGPWAGGIAALPALELWGTQIESPLHIGIHLSMAPLPEGVLAAGRPAKMVRGFANAPVPDAWSPVAFANKLAGVDFTPGAPDIYVTFNASISSWHGGTTPAPAGKYDSYSAALHAIALGLFGATANGSSNVGSWGSLAHPRSSSGSSSTTAVRASSIRRSSRIPRPRWARS